MEIEKIVKRSTTTTETTTVELTRDQLDALLLEHFGMLSGTVAFHMSRFDDEVDSVTLTRIVSTTKED